MLIAFVSGVVMATTVQDLTTAGATVTLGNGAVYKQGQPVPVSGTGVLDPFLRVQTNQSVEQGFSTNTNGQMDDSAGPWTHALNLGSVPTILVGGVAYREFLLDINQVNSQPLLSLDEVKIFLASTPNLKNYVDSTETFDGVSYPKVYDQGDNVIKLNYSLEAGSGKPDMTLLIPDSSFHTSGTDQYCFFGQSNCNSWMGFYSKFGAFNSSEWPNNDGFEEWATIIRPVVNVSKTATPALTTTYHWTIDKSVNQTHVDIASGGTATFNYTVTVNHDAGVNSGISISGNIVITNPEKLPDGTATVDATVSTVADLFHPTDNSGDTAGTVSCPGGLPQTLAGGTKGGATLTCTYTMSPSAAKNGINTATVTLSDTTVAPFTATAPVTFSSPTIVDGTITVVDDKTDPAHPVTLGTATYTQANPITFTYSLTKSGAAGTCTDYTNTATFTTNTTSTTGSDTQTVTVCVGVDLTVSKTATPAFGRKFTWGIDKSVDQTHVDIASGGTATFNYTVSVTHDAGTDSGWTVTGNITVTNPNDFEAITATITDAVDNGGTCTVTNGVSQSIAASSSITRAYTCTWASAPSSANGTNTATATWDKTAAHTPDGSATGTATFAFSSPTITDGSVTVVDTNVVSLLNPLGTLGTVSYTDPSPTTFTYSVVRSGVAGTCTDYDNTATFTTDTTLTTGSDSQTVTVCVGVDLTVSKTSAPTFTRTFTWGIAKDVDQTSVTINNGGTATFNYTVTVTHDSGTDSAWQLTGTITVTNPNDWEAITTTITDAVDNGGTCSVTNGVNVSIPASGSVTRAYTCTYASAPNPLTGTNTATATWDKTVAHTPDGTATGSAAADFSGAPTTIVDGSVVVTDTFAGTLGTVTYTDPSPTTFTYSRTITSADYTGCGTFTFPNTASFVTNTSGTTGSASQTVTVNVIGCAVFGKTPGFWHNKNGHAILSTDGVNLITPVTIGSNGHTFNVTTLAQSDKILSNDDCVVGTPTIFVCTGTNGLVTGLNTNTFEELGAQTLALTYNIGNITGYGGNTISGLSCQTFLTSALTGAPLNLTANSSVGDVLTAANWLIGHSFKNSVGGFATQQQEGAMNSLLGCLNRES